MKHCPKCKRDLDLENFCKDRARKDGLACWCKNCNRIGNAASAKKHPDSVRARKARYFEKHKDRLIAERKERVAADPERFAGYIAKYREKNPDAQREADARCYAKNREARLARDKAKREANIEDYRRRERESYERTKEKRAIRMKAWARANKAKISFYAAERRAAIGKRTPKWLDDLDFQLIEAYYWHAEFMSESTGVVHHVDHIVPLRGKTVSGLHVPWNLEVIPAIDNMKKGNRHAT